MVSLQSCHGCLCPPDDRVRAVKKAQSLIESTTDNRQPQLGQQNVSRTRLYERAASAVRVTFVLLRANGFCHHYTLTEPPRLAVSFMVPKTEPQEI